MRKVRSPFREAGLSFGLHWTQWAKKPQSSPLLALRKWRAAALQAPPAQSILHRIDRPSSEVAQTFGNFNVAQSWLAPGVSNIRQSQTTIRTNFR